MTDCQESMAPIAKGRDAPPEIRRESNPDPPVRNAVFSREKKGMMPDMHFRYATEADTAQILTFIRELADYEKMLNQVVADEETLRKWIFDKQKAEVIFALEDGKEVGFALFFHNFSTFLGRAGIYLEDLYVRPAYRGKGYGKGLITKLAQIAVERGCGRLEWWCLDWNRPSIDFYRSLGAEPMDDWTVYRIAGDTLTKLGTKNGDSDRA